jgi:serine/threonine protein kinase
MPELLVKRLGNKLGAGSYGTVYELGDDKVVKLMVLDERFACDFEADAMNEIKIMQRLKRETSGCGIMIMEQAFLEDTRATITMPRYAYTLRELMLRATKKEVTLTSDDRLSLIKQMCLGMWQCHRLSIAHRDVKPDNMLMRGTSGNYTLVIADFGLAKDIGTTITENNRKRLKQSPAISRPVISENYRPPELFMMEEDKTTVEADLWSVGVVIAELYLLRHLLASKYPGEARVTTLLYSHLICPYVDDTVEDIRKEVGALCMGFANKRTDKIAAIMRLADSGAVTKKEAYDRVQRIVREPEDDPVVEARSLQDASYSRIVARCTRIVVKLADCMFEDSKETGIADIHSVWKTLFCRDPLRRLPMNEVLSRLFGDDDDCNY